jgi:hypothetical protein
MTVALVAAEFFTGNPSTLRVDADAYHRHALDTLKATGELLPGCVREGEREHFPVRFTAGERFGPAPRSGKDSVAASSDE